VDWDISFLGHRNEDVVEPGVNFGWFEMGVREDRRIQLGEVAVRGHEKNGRRLNSCSEGEDIQVGRSPFSFGCAFTVPTPVGLFLAALTFACYARFPPSILGEICDG
jgi:hypothetical protein